MEKIEKYIYEAIASSQHLYSDNINVSDNGVHVNEIVKYVANKDINISEKDIKSTLNRSTYFTNDFGDIEINSKPIRKTSDFFYKLSEPIYFKYRKVYRKGKKHDELLDIFKNNRLYAAEYTKLNDPMEGLFWYNQGSLRKDHLREIQREKRKTKICSLCRNINNPIMWAHYANGFNGISIGVEILDKDFAFIEYTNEDMVIADYSNKTARDILSKKLKCWQYEREVRSFSYEDFINVNIKIVFLGQRMTKYMKDKVKKELNKINSNIIVVDDFNCETQVLQGDNVY
jgi:hypothetical protein